MLAVFTILTCHSFSTRNIKQLFDIVHDDQTPADSDLDEIRAKFYDSPFRSPQFRVCKEILNGRYLCGASPSSSEVRDDIFFVAPCGFGKSLCFVVAAHALGGITVRSGVYASSTLYYRLTLTSF